MEAENTSLSRKERKAKANREATLKKPIVSPRIASNPFDFIFFTWFGPILRLGFKRPIQHDDLPTLPEQVKTENNYPEFRNRWNSFLQRSKTTEKGRTLLKRTEDGQTAGPLFKTLYGIHAIPLAWALLLQLGYNAQQFAGPLLLKKITTFLNNSVYGLEDVDVSINYLWAALMFICPMIGAVLYVHSSRLSIVVQIKMRAELTAAVYRKALALSSRSRQQTELGKIVNLMSADVNHVMQFFYPFFNQLFSAPALLIASLILLYFQIKWATFIGMAILMASTPASAIFVKKIIMFRRKMLKETDSRVKLTNQLLSGIRVLKIYAWEAAQEAQIQEARDRELRRLKQAIPCRVGMQTLLFAAPVLAAVASFAVYGSVDPDGFTAPRIFASIALFAIMRFPLIFLPFALVEMGNAMVSLRRLSQYLVMEERNDTVEQMPQVGLDVQGGQFYWSEPPATKKLEGVKGAPGQGKKRSLLSVFGGLRLRKGPAIGTGPAKGSDKEKDDKVEADDVAVPMDRTQDASKLGRQVAPGESSSSSSSSSSDGQAEHLYSDKPITADGKEVGELVSTANDKSSGQVKKGSNNNPEGAPDATWWLRDVNITVGPGELACVVGRVGSGKSSLIGALLGEMEKHAGTVRMGGQLAYVAQQAWIVNDSLQSNVLFGQELEDQKWEACVHSCSLQQDLEMLPGGVDTEIGEKGINLSGGQKQRISLARAVYADADFYIMDDPLSAVDVHVGRHIFDHCISGVLAKKTRLLVTNQLQYLPKADKIIYIESGRVVGQGSLEKVSLIPGFASLLNEFNSKAEQQDPEEELAKEHLRQDQMFGELNAAEGKPEANTTSTVAPPHSVRTFATTTPVVNQTVGEAYADFANVEASVQRNMPVGDTDAVEPLATNVELVRLQNAEDEAGLDLDDAVTRQASGELRRYTIDPAAARSGGAFDTTHRDFTDPDLIDDERSEETGLRHRRTAMTDSQRLLQLEGTSGRDPDATQGRTWGGSFRRRSKESLHDPTSRKSLTGPSDRSLNGGSRRSLDGGSRRSLQTSRRSLEVQANSLMSDRSKKQLEVMPAAPEEVVNKGGKVLVKAPDGKLVVQEDRASGQVTTEIYKLYGKAYGWYSLLALCFFWASEQSTNILTSWWLSQWATAQILFQIRRAQGLNVGDPRGQYLGGYIGFGLGYVCLVAVRSIINLLAGWQASRRIHHASMASLCLAPVSFFDTTPIGRILNRFAKDTDDMDYLLPQSITELGNCLMQLAATLIFVSIVQPIFLAGMVPLMIVYFFLQKYYRRSYVELQRCDATSRSPVYAHFSESLTGVETIRAFRYQEKFASKSDTQIDYNHRAYWTLKTADQWLSLRLDFIGACLILLTAILAIANRNNINPAIAALSLSQFMKYAVQSAAMFESRFNSVERILAYAKLKPEAPHHILGKQAPADWPHAGVISYQNVVMKYRPELEPVLKGVSFEVAAGEKVGIVGRTGSGKSSLIVTLFRIVEPDGGVISLDGLDLGSLGLNDVRGRIAAIPQDPVLFSGTVRSNLDPYGRHEDHELWEALGHVALKETVSQLSEGLGARVAEGGDNFSVGQRQLLCVARALLRKPRVLVADEATASVDGETDALIQRTIRANFKDSTVLTIAHRLNTILDSTKVLVMEDGRVKEYDSPANLMQIPNGTFRAMVVEAGLSDDSATSALQ
ncbi:hypothetical protein ABBQ32_013696 [Trebouxia sp. C0010 RCD-2024]